MQSKAERTQFTMQTAVGSANSDVPCITPASKAPVDHWSDVVYSERFILALFIQTVDGRFSDSSGVLMKYFDHGKHEQQNFAFLHYCDDNSIT